jgi:RNA polymerase sigma-70 factor (ECF subfamily)
MTDQTREPESPAEGVSWDGVKAGSPVAADTATKPIPALAVCSAQTDVPVHTLPDAANLSQWVAEHGPVLYRYAYRLTGSTADAEDLTQQTFLLGYRKLTQLRDPAGARPWLMAILRREYLRSAMKSATERRLVVPLNVDTLPAELVDRWEVDEEALQNAINGLADVYKLVVLSFYFEDLSYREIAEQLDLPVGTVMSRLSRAKAQLRSRLFERELQAVSERGVSERGVADCGVPDCGATEWPPSGRPAGES